VSCIYQSDSRLFLSEFHQESFMQLTVQNLGKQYKRDFWGLKGFSLDIKPGILGLLGPNGAGKSTFMRMLATITKPTEGTILWNDTDVVKSPDTLRGVLGYLPQDFGVYPNLTAVEFLEYMAAIKGLDAASTRKRIEELLLLVNLKDAAKRPLGGYSGGMKQRVGIAQALLNDPQLLIVDEPTVGLDPEERVRFRNLLSDLSGERIVILSTHIVSDVEASATALAVMAAGRLRFHGTPEALIARANGHVWEWTLAPEQLADVRAKFVVCASLRRPDGIRVRVVNSAPPHPEAQAVAPGLEDAYTWLLGADARQH
jgi:ABC-type multidrug transport system ATPase subunit